jgi:hypothetical protein
MEGVMDEAYNYGRNWITATLRNRVPSYRYLLSADCIANFLVLKCFIPGPD